MRPECIGRVQSEVAVAELSVGSADAEPARATARLPDQVVGRILPGLAGLLIVWLSIRLTDFYYDHAWASAHFATIAQSFAGHGILGLGGIPIENFDPLTSQPDNYLHWPPLYFYALSLVQRMFPESIRAMHLFMATIALANAVVIRAIAARFFNPRAAMVCGSAFLLMPATLRYGLVLLPVNLAMLEVALALLSMLRSLQGAEREKAASLGLGTLLFLLACLTSWEAFLALPGLLLAYGLDRRPEILRTGLCWTAAAIAAGAGTLSLYGLSDPTFFNDLWSIFTFRLGLTPYLPQPARIHPVEGQLEAIDGVTVFYAHPTFNFFEAYVVRMQNFCGALGLIGLFALASTALRRHRAGADDGLAVLLLPLATIWLGWAGLMQGHYIIHTYQFVLATPLLALGVGCLYALLDDAVMAAPDLRARQGLAIVKDLAIPAALLLSGMVAAATTLAGDPEAFDLAGFGRRIRAEVPAGAMVLTSEMSMVQTFYAQRHVIRGVPDGGYVEARLQTIQDICPGCALYLALRRANAAKFQGLLDRLPPLFADDDYIIRKIEPLH